MTRPQSTDDLIRALSAMPAPPVLAPARAVSGVVAVACLLTGLFLLVTGLRADLDAALALPAVQAKTAVPLSLSALALWLAALSLRPGGRVRLPVLLLPLMAVLVLVALRLPAVPEGTLLAEVTGKTAMACLASITGLSVLPIAAGILLFRRGAPTRPALSGALLGMGTGALIAAGYALHCTEDSPLFFSTWYGAGIMACAVLGAVAGRVGLRW